MPTESERPRTHPPRGGPEYRILEADSAAELEQKVQRLLDKGWRLQGGPFTSSVTFGTTGYYQALTRG